jgi:hypothetical protein
VDPRLLKEIVGISRIPHKAKQVAVEPILVARYEC